MHEHIGFIRGYSVDSIMKRLLFVVIVTTSVDVVEAELVCVLGGSHDTDPVPERVLLQELFCEVLKVALGQGDAGCHSDFRVSIANNFDVLSKLASLTIDFDSIVQELLKVCAVKNTICSRLGVVDNEFVLGGRCLVAGRGLGGLHRKKRVGLSLLRG